jgi:hypothetical protein
LFRSDIPSLQTKQQESNTNKNDKMIPLARALCIFTALAALGSAKRPKVKSAFDLTLDIYGPLDTWRPIRAIDIDPKSIVDGKPVNDSFIVGYEPPRLSVEMQAEKHSQLLELVANVTTGASARHGGEAELVRRTLRSWCGIPAANALVPLDQLRLATGYFCSRNYASAWWETWPRLVDGTYVWQYFTTRDGQRLPVWVGGGFRAGYRFDSYRCSTAFASILYDCYNYPYSTGGVGEDHPGGYDAVLMPKWFAYADR